MMILIWLVVILNLMTCVMSLFLQDWLWASLNFSIAVMGIWRIRQDLR
jgi:membrane glycosyltransferase